MFKVQIFQSMIQSIPLNFVISLKEILQHLSKRWDFCESKQAKYGKRTKYIPISTLILKNQFSAR